MNRLDIKKIKPIKNIKIISLMGGLILLSGCASMNGNFGCNAKANRRCTPVSKVNAKAAAGDFDHQTRGAIFSLPSSSTMFSYASQHAGYQGTMPILGKSVRTEERLQRIWIAPYQDRANNYHESNTIYTVLKKPHWIGLPAKEIKTRDTEQDDEG